MKVLTIQLCGFTRRSNVWNICTCTLAYLLLVTLASVSGTQAQSKAQLNPIDTEYATGLELVSPDTYLTFDKVPTYRAYLPEFVDLSAQMPTPGSQGRLNACVGWAVGYAARSYYSVAVENKPRDVASFIPSPSYIYNRARKYADCSKGSRIPDALDLLLVKGSLSLAEYPYADECMRPTDAEIEKDHGFKIKWWMRVDLTRIDDIKGQLAKQNPIVIGINAPKSLLKLRGDEILQPDETPFGPHALVVVGYNDKKQAFKIMNSWGQGWGNGGFGWMSYASFNKYAREAYVMTVTPPRPTIAQFEDTASKTKPRPNIVATKGKLSPPNTMLSANDKLREKKSAVQRAKSTTDISCSKITTTKHGEQRVVSGFVSKPADVDALERTYTPSQFKYDVEIRPWPQCEILLTLDRQLAVKDRPKIEIADNRTMAVEGEPLTVNVTTPTTASYIYVSYIQADGKVVHLEQPAALAPRPNMPRSLLTFGDGKEGRAKFTVAPPFGSEIVVVLASSSPLFDTNLPADQIERDYLSALRKAIIYKPDPKMPDRNLSASYAVIETTRKSQ